MKGRSKKRPPAKGLLLIALFKLVKGALLVAVGIGALKLKLHRAGIGQLFERADQVLDAEEIYEMAKVMV